MSADNGVAAADLHVRITNHDLALKSRVRSSCAECDWTWTTADDLLRRAKTQLDLFERRDTTAVPGTVTLVRDLVAEVERLRAERDALRSVVRRYRDGWTDLPFGRVVRWCREGPTVDDPDLIRRWEPMTPAEADAIRNAIWGTGQ